MASSPGSPVRSSSRVPPRAARLRLGPSWASSHSRRRRSSSPRAGSAATTTSCARPGRNASAPAHLLSGVPEHVDGRMIGIAEQTAGASVINRDRMWHYVEGIKNWNPVWPMHGIRILPGPSSLWLDATGKRLPQPLYPGFDTLGTLDYLQRTGYDHSWFILTERIIAKEFALSGSEQNPDLTGRDRRAMCTHRVGGPVPGPVQAFPDKGADFVTAASLPRLVAAMNELTGGEPALDAAAVEREIRAR